MHGKATVTCRADGNWADAAPDCKSVQCPTPRAPTHGAVNGVDFRFDNEVLYSCDKGYQLVGDVARKCLASGAWSSPEPRCDRKSKYTSFSTKEVVQLNTFEKECFVM